MSGNDLIIDDDQCEWCEDGFSTCSCAIDFNEFFDEKHGVQSDDEWDFEPEHK